MKAFLRQMVGLIYSGELSFPKASATPASESAEEAAVQ